MTKPTRREEHKLFRQGYTRIAGVDEAGRGAWAGPIVAAAVILPRKIRLPGVNDSKKLSARQRERLYVKITDSAVAWSTAVIAHTDIDRFGLGPINRLVLQQSVEHLQVTPEFVLIDSLKCAVGLLPCRSIIKGDAKVVSIAAASIVAKVTRDRLMCDYHRRYPLYNFHQHKGYGTASHREKIRQHGLSPLHRRSFEPMKSMVRG